ncbi:hypothetical protein OBBRIDRAFT_181806 [Obba rivulosa]|uniref:Uncharacterized protein n=1 Tax=Obba rivulosa TaxID=1052685 RepID=A0A8E2DRA1_9APHY|nr:hypothetical protein OBBRIDRAFT_181806 [Obba rivulosa]
MREERKATADGSDDELQQQRQPAATTRRLPATNTPKHTSALPPPSAVFLCPLSPRQCHSESTVSLCAAPCFFCIFCGPRAPTAHRAGMPSLRAPDACLRAAPDCSGQRQPSSRYALCAGHSRVPLVAGEPRRGPVVVFPRDAPRCPNPHTLLAVPLPPLDNARGRRRAIASPHWPGLVPPPPDMAAHGAAYGTVRDLTSFISERLSRVTSVRHPQ